MNNGNKKICPFADEIVSYIYDEITALAESTQFEDHLAECTVCTDDFAAVSEARFSVFEWQRDEFADLPTPEIVIPYERTKISVGLWTGLRGWLQWVNLPVAAAAAVLLVILCVGFATLKYLGHTEKPVAFNVKERPVEPPDQAADFPTQNVAEQKGTEASEKKTPQILAVETGKTLVRDTNIRPVKGAARRQAANRTPMAVMKEPVKKTPLQDTSNAPVLNNYEENSDNSLRLADLFADIDG